MTQKLSILFALLAVLAIAVVGCPPPTHPDAHGDGGGGDDDDDVGDDDDTGDDDGGGGCADFCAWENGDCMDWYYAGMTCEDYCDQFMDSTQVECMAGCPTPANDDYCACFTGCLGY